MAAIEAYKIGISLIVEGNAERQVGELNKAFATLERTIRDVQMGMNELASGARAVARAGQSAADSWARAAAAMQRAATAARSAAAATARMGAGGGSSGGGGGSSGGGSGSPPLPPSLPALPPPGGGGLVAPGFRPPVAGGAGGSGGGGLPPLLGYSGANGPIPLNPNFPRPGRQWRSPVTLRRPRLPGSHQLAADGAMAAAPAYAGFEFLRGLFDQGVEKGALLAQMQQQGFSASEAQAAYDAATRTQRAAPGDAKGALGSSIMGNMEIAADLMAVLQNTKQATEAMPAFARLAVVLDQFGKGAEGKGLMEAIRAGEFRGALVEKDPKTGEERISVEKLSTFLNNVQALTLMTKGQLGPAAIYQFLRSGGVAAAQLGDQGLFADAAALMLAMKPAQAGTGLRAFEQQFAGGKMSQTAFSLLQEMGVFSRDPHTFKKYPVGNIMLLPGAYAGGEQVRQQAISNPVAFATEYLLPRMERWLAQKYGKAYTQGDDKTKDNMLFALAQTLASRVPAGTALAEFFRQLPLIQRDRVAAAAAQKRDAYDMATTQNPQVMEKAFEASWQALKIALSDAGMKQAIEAMNAITVQLNAFSDWAKTHPETVAAALKLFAVAVGAFAVGATAALALAVLTNPVGGIVAVATGISALGMAFPKLRAEVEAFLKMLTVFTPAGPGKPGSFGNVFPSDPNAYGEPRRGLPSPGGASPTVPNMTVRPEKQGYLVAPDGAPIRVIVVNAADVGHAAAGGAVSRLTSAAWRPPTGPTAGDLRSGPAYPGRLTTT